MSSFRFDWYQTETSIIIDVFVKNLKPENLNIIFTETNVHIKINTGELSYDKLFELSQSIDPENCKYSIGKVKVEVELKKFDPKLTWKYLESSPKDFSIDSFIKYPSSARNPIDINKIRDTDLEPEPTGEAAINALFQKIYADSSEDTRRAMMKSFVESKGTVLSTNWNEVGENNVQPIPPKN